MRSGLGALVVVIVACGGSGGGTSGATDGGGGSANASSGGAGSSTGGTAGKGGTSSGGVSGASGGSGGGVSGSGGTSSGGSAGVDAGPVIPGGPCVEPVATPASPPCAMGAPKQSYCRTSSPSEVIMATCSTYGETQCDAAQACAPGWHFCTGTEYLDRGGRTVPKADGIIYAWIAACVRDAGSNALKDGACSVCDTDVGMPPGMIYGCQGESISPGMIDDTIGAMADTTCHRIGENVPANAGYWSINFSGHKAAHTLCCIDGA